MTKSASTALTKASINKMIANRDFSSVEGNVPAFIAILLQMSAPVMQQALKIALENEKIRKETNKYIHETSKSIINDYTSIVKQEQLGLSETNKRLGDALIQLSKIENPTTEQITLYLNTLQAIQENSGRMTESRQQAEQFLSAVQEKETEITVRKPSPIWGYVLDFAQTPEGSKFIVDVGTAIFKALTNRK